MRTITVNSYPEEGMALVFFKGKDIVTQCIYASEKFGIYTLFQGKWRKLSNNDESLNDYGFNRYLPC
jgi:hypothetical protein